MKRLFKIVGISVSFLLGSLLITNASMVSQIVRASMPTKVVNIGETVGFNLTRMFGDKADPKTLWVIAPDGAWLTLTNTSMFVISNVRLEDEGLYRFYAQNRDGVFEYCVALIVIEPEPYCENVLMDLQFLKEWVKLDISFFALKPDDEMCFV